MQTKHTPGRRKGAYTQASRVLAILELVRAEGAPVALARIAAELGVSERQARRDVAMLADASPGVRSTLLDGRSAVELVEPDTVRLTLRERTLLAGLASFADQLGPGALGDELRAAMHKLALSAREEERCPASVVAGPSTPTSAATGDKVDRVERAIRERVELRVRLSSERDDARLLTFLPYVIALHATGPHVVGRWDPTEPVRAVPLERFAHVELAPGTFVPAPQSIDLPRLFEAPRATAAARAAHT